MWEVVWNRTNIPATIRTATGSLEGQHQPVLLPPQARASRVDAAVSSSVRPRQLPDIAAFAQHDLKRTARSLMSRADVSSTSPNAPSGTRFRAWRDLRQAQIRRESQCPATIGELIESIINPPEDNVVAISAAKKAPEEEGPVTVCEAAAYVTGDLNKGAAAYTSSPQFAKAAQIANSTQTRAKITILALARQIGWCRRPAAPLVFGKMRGELALGLQKRRIAMRNFTPLIAIGCGLALGGAATPGGTAPLSNAATSSPEPLYDQSLTHEVKNGWKGGHHHGWHHRGGRHYGWYRGRHYGWYRGRHYGSYGWPRYGYYGSRPTVVLQFGGPRAFYGW